MQLAAPKIVLLFYPIIVLLFLAPQQQQQQRTIVLVGLVSGFSVVVLPLHPRPSRSSSSFLLLEAAATTSLSEADNDEHKADESTRASTGSSSRSISHADASLMIAATSSTSTSSISSINDENVSSCSCTTVQPIAAAAAVPDKSTNDQQNQETPTTNITKPLFELRVVLIDHYDSYTYNLYNILDDLCTTPPLVLAKDFTGPLPLNDIDALVLSPGPGRPSCSIDMGRTLSLIEEATAKQVEDTPILGVCLGHQALAHVHGAIVSECYPAVHGQVHEVELLFCHDNNSIKNNNNNLWEGMTSDDGRSSSNDGTTTTGPTIVNVTRYHSLAVQPDSLPETLLVTAMLYNNNNNNEHDDNNNVIMALQHKTLPHYGVQFHPESIGTPQGYRMVENFLKICERKKKEKKKNDQAGGGPIENQQQQATTTTITKARDDNDLANEEEPRTKYYVSTRRLANLDDAIISTQHVFEHLYSGDSHAIWLDSSRQFLLDPEDHDENKEDMFGRYSIMAGMMTKTSGGGSVGSPSSLSKRIEYYGKEHDLVKQKQQGVHVTGVDGITTIVGDNSGSTNDIDILDYLRQVQEGVELVFENSEASALPFVGGHLGYLGYEVRHDTQRKLDKMEQAPMQNDDDGGRGKLNGISEEEQSRRTNPNVPTAAFLFADQSILFDHLKKEWHLVEVTLQPNIESVWMDVTEASLREMDRLSQQVVERARKPPSPKQQLDFLPNRSRSAYQADIAECHDQIRRGESYELCLTNQLETTVSASSDRSPWDLYKILRHRNPAPFAAFMNFQGKESTTRPSDARMSICCSSPERFISVQPSSTSDELLVEAKPIKGTAARPDNSEDDARVAQELEQSIKNRAENLMIVDLLRNDLNRVCKTGTVHVPKLMMIESYATVHQLVSTIRGVLDTNKNALDVLTACFPGGSMTGAPKRRTMDILHEMEEGVSRGPYSGCLGYISLNGHMDMNIVIRSAVLTPSSSSDESWNVSIGAGGAITALSESDDEYEEMLLKARAVKESVDIWASEAKESNGQVSESKVYVDATPLLQIDAL